MSNQVRPYEPLTSENAGLNTRPEAGEVYAAMNMPWARSPRPTGNEQLLDRAGGYAAGATDCQQFHGRRTGRSGVDHEVSPPDRF